MESLDRWNNGLDKQDPYYLDLELFDDGNGEYTLKAYGGNRSLCAKKINGEWQGSERAFRLTERAKDFYLRTHDFDTTILSDWR